VLHQAHGTGCFVRAHGFGGAIGAAVIHHDDSVLKPGVAHRKVEFGKQRRQGLFLIEGGEGDGHHARGPSCATRAMAGAMVRSVRVGLCM